MKYRLINYIALIILFFSVVNGIAYDQTRPDENIIPTDRMASFSYVRVKTIGTAYGLQYNTASDTYSLKEGLFGMSGSGIVVSPGYIITAAHVVMPDTLSIADSRVGKRKTDVIAMLTRIVMVTDYKDTPIIVNVLYENVESDIAVLTYNYQKNSWLTPIPYPLEFYETINENMGTALKAGDIVCTVTHNRSKDGCEYGEMLGDVRLVWGTVMNAWPYGPNNKILTFLSAFDITLNLDILPGDSGSPLFAFRDGKPIFVGIVKSHYLDECGFFTYTWATRLPIIWRLFKNK